MTTTFGDSHVDGHAELQGFNIPMTQGPVRYEVTFYDDNMRYTLVRNDQSGGAGPHADQRLPFRPRSHRLDGA